MDVKATLKNINSNPIILLSQEEVLSLRPKDRDTYAEKIIIQLLEANPKGVTVSEIVEITGLNRSTITKHSKKLVAIREAHRQVRGNLSIYYKNGTILSSKSILNNISRNTSYTFMRIINDEGKYIYLQEKTNDNYGASNVSGGIMISDKDILDFLNELQKFALEAID